MAASHQAGLYISVQAGLYISEDSSILSTRPNPELHEYVL